jgi:hypothetical protein
LYITVRNLELDVEVEEILRLIVVEYLEQVPMAFEAFKIFCKGVPLSHPMTDFVIERLESFKTAGMITDEESKEICA